MAQARKGKLNYRCPNCFKRDIDMDLFYDPIKNEYYCLRCCYHASEEEILKDNQQIKQKYPHRLSRVTSFGEDNGSVEFKDYKKGEL